MSEQLREQLRKYKRNEKVKYKEQLTDKEIKELMGVHRPTYKRVRGGAIRQK